MIAPATHSVDSAILLHYVLEPAVRSLALAGAVWILLKAFRVRDVAFRLAVWTAVLYAALAMPFLGKLMPELPVLIPVQHIAQPVSAGPTTATSVPRGRAAGDAVAPGAIAPLARTGRISSAANAPAGHSAAADKTSAPATSIPWMALAMGIYCALAAIFLGRLGLGIFLSTRLRRSSQRIDDRRLAALLARETRKAGLRKVPAAAESRGLSIPATLGVWHPVVLFPSGWQAWSDTQLSAVLAHELSHISRRDALTRTLSDMHRAFFWFSPLSWRLDRTLADLAEEASDDAALLAGADRIHYAEVLLHFFRTLKAASGRVHWQAVSMAQGANSARRLERILSGSRLPRRLGQTAMAAVVLSVVPLVCLAAAVHPSLLAEASLAASFVSAPPGPPAIASIPVPLTGKKELPPVPAETMTAHVAAPRTVQPRRISQRRPEIAMRQVEVREEMEGWYSSSRGSSYLTFAVVSSTMRTVPGASAKTEHVQELRGRFQGNPFWSWRDNGEFAVNDPTTAQAAIVAFAQQRNLEREQIMLVRELETLALLQSQFRFPSPTLSAEIRWLGGMIHEINLLQAQGRRGNSQAKV